MPVGLLYFGMHHMPTDRFVLADQPLDHFEIGAGVGHRHRDHLDAEVLADREVAVVAGHRAEKRHARALRPRTRAVARAAQQRVGDGVVHQPQAGVVADQRVLGLEPEQRRQQRAQFREALEHAVVARVAAVCGEVVARAGKREQRAGQIELLGRGFATGEIQFHSPGGEIVVAPACGVVDGAHLLWRCLGQVGHGVGGGHAPPE